MSEDELSKLKVVETAQDGQGVKSGTDAQPEAETLPASLPAPVAPTLSGLPSANLNHSASWAAETLINLQRFQNGKAALEAELDGKQREHQAAIDDLARKFAELANDLAARIKDMDEGIAMCEAALDKADELKKIAPQ